MLKMPEQELTKEQIDEKKNSNEVLTNKIKDLTKRVEALEKI